jgi:hypothetical protein
MFYAFCDALEVKDGVNAPAEGWGLDHTLQAWGNLWTNGGYLNRRKFSTTVVKFQANDSYQFAVVIRQSMLALNFKIPPLIDNNHNNRACLGTYDPTQAFYTDTSVDNSGRSWMWIV